MHCERIINNVAESIWTDVPGPGGERNEIREWKAPVELRWELRSVDLNHE